MPPALIHLLIATPLVLFGARAARPGIPWKPYARPSSRVDIGLIALGAAGLLLHCVAMFYPSLIETIPGTGG